MEGFVVEFVKSVWMFCNCRICEIEVELCNGIGRKIAEFSALHRLVWFVNGLRVDSSTVVHVVCILWCGSNSIVMEHDSCETAAHLPVFHDG